MRRSLRWAVVLCFVFASSKARAEPTREFIMSATYGVLAGTLVGAATLAFTDHPGDNLKNIARGASYGLYAGILLGLYVAYGIPGADETGSPAAPDEYQGDSPEERSTNPEEPLGPQGGLFKPQVFPLISEKGVEGAGLAIQYTF
jgi:hypothetical protein